MRGFLGLTKRNLFIYFKDVHAIIFSLLTSIIVFVLYLVFLKGTFVDSIHRYTGGLEGLIADGDIELLVGAILLVGILGSAMITVPYSCLKTVISDRETKIDYDISATPIKRWQIILSYFLAATISAIVVTSVIFTLGLLILSSMGDMNMSAWNIIACYLVVVLGSFSATGFFMVMILLFKSSSACDAFFGMLSAASGFVIGAYIPLSSFSSMIQTICNLFPATQVTILLRNTLLTGILDKINEGIGGIDQGAFVQGIKSSFNFNANMLEHSFTVQTMITYVAVFFVISVIGMVVIYTKTYKRK